MGRQSDGDSRIRIDKKGAFPSKLIDVGSGFVLVAVTAKEVGAAGVDADEDDITNIFIDRAAGKQETTR